MKSMCRSVAASAVVPALLPVTVAVDSEGTSVHTTGPAEWSKRIATGEFTKIPVAAV